jgi:predicted O-linked N-acetylglucosamine transferase (SPINDLY family)
VNLGSALQKLGRLEEAVERLSDALRLKADIPEALNCLGMIFYRQGKLDESIETYKRALHIKPEFPEALNNLGKALQDSGQLDAAIERYSESVRLLPGFAVGWSQLSVAKKYACDWVDSSACERRVLEDLRAGNPSVISPFAVLILDSSPQDQLTVGRKWAKYVGTSCAAPLPPAAPKTEQRIRIGYLSADFRRHATAFLATGMFESHDRSKFETIAYSIGADDGSEDRQRLEKAFCRFVDIRAVSYEAAARKIRDDGIDILVDLKGYTDGARSEILAFKPAPIQVNYLGYPGTTGATFIDYIIIDPFLVPPAMARYFSEKLVHIPVSYQPNMRRMISEHYSTRAEYGLPDSAFVFCCFNNVYKITPAIFDIWMRLLHAVPASVLWLLDCNSLARANLSRQASARGVNPGRLIFSPKQQLATHLARHRHADLFLDTLPVGGHTTTSDALWAGLPLVCCVGETFASRVSGSLLTALDLPELITRSLEEYEALALHLAQHPDELAGVRRRLWNARLASPLFKPEPITRHLESAFARMWQIHCLGEAPRSFDVDNACERLRAASAINNDNKTAEPQRIAFNICHIKINNHSSIFSEVIKSLRASFENLGYECTVTTNSLIPNAVNIIIGSIAFAAKQIEFLNGQQYILYNFEQLHNEHGHMTAFPEYTGILEAAAFILEYSVAGMDYFAGTPFNDKVAFLPPLFHQSLESFELTQEGDREIDVLFYGSHSERRHKILDELRDSGKKVAYLFGIYGHELIEYIKRSKIVVNIHFWDNLDALETPRISYLLANRCFVISEIGDHNPYGSGVVYSAYEDLVATCLEYLGPRAAMRASIAAAGHEEYRRSDLVVSLRSVISQMPIHQLINSRASMDWNFVLTDCGADLALKAARVPHQASAVARTAFRPVEKLAIVTPATEHDDEISRGHFSKSLRALADEPGVSLEIVSGNIVPELSSDTAGICILRHTILSGEPGLELIKQLLGKGYIIVSEFDVDPGVFPALPGSGVLSFRGVHAVQTNNAPLADILRVENQEITIFPDTISGLPEVRNFADPQRRTLFFGGINRTQDWAPLLPALNAAATSVGERLRFSIVHDRTLFDGLDTPHKSFVPTCDHETYLRLLGQSEIAFLPLADTALNRIKSDFEFVEAAACRVAALASPIVYGSSIEDGNTGVLFRTPEELLYRLAWLVVNPSAVALGDAARKWVAEHRLLADQAKARIAWYHALIARRTALTNALHARVPELTAGSPGQTSAFAKQIEKSGFQPGDNLLDLSDGHKSRPGMNGQRLILVLGCHRSGTSAVARSLKCMGVTLGQMAEWSASDNPTGFWEHSQIIQLDQLILRLMGKDWDDPAPWGDAVLEFMNSHPEAKKILEAGREIVTGELSQHRLFGLKEPRMCRLLPIWRSLLQQTDCDVSVVRAVRHPAAVADSLWRRNRIPAEKALRLWLEHVQRVRFDADPTWRTVTVDADALMHEPASQIERIGANLRLAADWDQVASFKDEFLRDGLWHVPPAMDLPPDVEAEWVVAHADGRA